MNKLAIIILLSLCSIPHLAQAAMCDYDGDGAIDAGWSVVGGVCVPNPATVGNLSNKSVEDIATNAMSWVIGFAGLVAILGFLISAFLYFTAAGDEDRAKLGKQAFWYSAIGAAIALGAYAIMKIIDNFLKAGAI
jgi:hypothetical protein